MATKKRHTKTNRQIRGFYIQQEHVSNWNLCVIVIYVNFCMPKKAYKDEFYVENKRLLCKKRLSFVDGCKCEVKKIVTQGNN